MITTLHLGLSYTCNFHCSHCYVHKKKDSLDVPAYKTIIKALYDQGLLVILYTYGEPLLSDKLEPVAGYANSLGISQTILSNGWLVDEERVKRYSDLGVNSYNISLDSMDPSFHDQNRNCVGSFDRAVAAIRLLVRSGKYVGIGMTVTERNVGEIEKVKRFACEEGVARVSFLAQRKDGLAVDICDSAYRNVFESAILGKGKDTKFFFHDSKLLPDILSLYHRGAIDEDTYSRWWEMNSCHMAHSLSVEPNGDVHRCNLCASKMGRIVLDGDIGSELRALIGGKYENFVCCPLLSGEG